MEALNEKRKFHFKEKNIRIVEEINVQPFSQFKETLYYLTKNKLAVVGLIIILLLIIMAVIGPKLVTYSYSDQSLLESNQPPSKEHWFGTDQLGRDIFARTWTGARISLFIGIMAVLIDLIVGIIIGGIAGLKGGKTDEILMRLVDILYGLPHLLVTILLMVVLKPGLTTIILAMAATGWIGIARLVRGQILQLKECEYVMASRVLGAGFYKILFKHLLPNTLGPIIVAMTLSVPGAIFAEATLSFLGLGVPVPLASWGTMTSEALVTLLTGHLWILFFPAFFISLTMFAFNVVGDGLRDALDPKMRT
ncbi:MAG: ABC transporter permease [Bacillota bacterium]|jgi:ABC-type dipeptide/oligopeptide/nickel transport system permease subunit|uniref:ABC transporter permease n=1 Tax=Fictibacillus TaxID=1329200 RepID=UPI0018CE495F|nr:MULTISPECIES: ABC transporter permease [unclassified Fictibacillus]MBH0157202.1 ABC transporter permease [Fictibacillus sp. 5RED26]MBH0159523.1 ABC transporter permease [Fictibacillus sp. 26RED30]MBH0163677.1 ABC transporter permease [Fictibacillus sp. 7GRE50]MBH0169696.1 ABC transporter permease [Fictibacillus sp. 18YEL24]MBH0174196.1 ABC transporter permease [Fictibacillus sp. 23RED33]